MKKILLLALLLLSYFSQNLMAQHIETLLNGAPQTHPTVEYKGMEVPADVEVKPNTLPQQNRPEAMFDVQFIMRANDSLPAGIAKRGYGIMWTGTEFWLSQWTSDSIARYSKEGRLLGFLRTSDLPAVTGNTGIRHFAREGANVWAVNNSEVLMRIDPITGQILERVTMPLAVGTIRYITWDATEGGGFWVGNTNTDLFKVTKTGQIIRTIPRSIHGIIAMTGLAYDSTNVGGPFLWVNCQAQFSNTLSGTFVRQIKVSNGFGTSLIRDIKVDLPLATSNLAGSLGIAQITGFAKPSLLVVAQNTTNHSGAVIGYELDFAPPTTFDIGIDSFETANGFTIVPKAHRVSSALKVKARNIGFINALNVPIRTELYRDFTAVTSTSTQENIPSLSFSNFNVLNNFTATDTGTYLGIMTAKLNGDPNPLNDTARLYFQIKDSTYARDFMDVPTNTSFISFSFGAGSGLPLIKKLGNVYRFPIATTINSVTVRSRPIAVNDSVQVKIYRVQNGQVSDSIAVSSVYYTTAQDSIASISPTGAMIRTLRLTRPLSVLPNENILICLAEGTSTMRLSGTTRGFQPSTAFGFTGKWINFDTIANANFRSAFYIRPNVNIRVGTQDISNFEAVSVYPNPTQESVTIHAALNEMDDLTIKIYDLAGRLVLSDKAFGQTNFTKNYPLSNLGVGMYILKMESSKGVWQEKIIKQ